ncbi:MAG: phosphoribosylanthranilate isomerase [Terracidiphilus sp.]
MSLWIKICGNTSLDDARVAADAGADALGFVFTPSPRQVTVAQAAAIHKRLPASVERIGVFVDASMDEIFATVRGCGLTGVQLHFDIDADFTAGLRARLGPLLRILRVVHFGPEAAAQLEAIAADENVDAVLVDSRTMAAVGGTGVAYDWNAARTSLFQNHPAAKPLVAAGGLTPWNVAQAISTLRPWGVDVASGVEEEPGHKDHDALRAFIANARAARRG